ncbi:hypothetical protein RUM44_002849 [Polyplax serrata]|uniref:phosphoribosylformylglycinamidine synthase n=1 Tax=Polyplax serrata TaxID=468196 RepID=A0ABR1AWW1_POLSC
MGEMTVLHYYRVPGLSDGATSVKLEVLKEIFSGVSELKTESCFNIKITKKLTNDDERKLRWILGSPQKPESLAGTSFLDSKKGEIIEIGPRLNFSTAFSSNAVSICQSVGIQGVERLELSIRYQIFYHKLPNAAQKSQIISNLHDRMTQTQYVKPLESFDLGVKTEKWFEIDIMGQGRKALESVNQKLGRNPTSVECFDLAQSNSEHSRHWFFKGRMIVDGVEEKESLIDMIINTQNYSNGNNVIKFSDNSSAIEGFTIQKFRPQTTTKPAPFTLVNGKSHLIFTAETHNFPTGVAPFSGATTGTGGRLRDVQCVGRGGYYIAGTAGYSVGNLYIPGYDFPWEDKNMTYPDNFASPLEIIVEASNGASDYGNKFGEPVISGFARSFGLNLKNERREWIKPIMFSGGLGTMDDNMTAKMTPKKGMRVVKVGGPVYRIGVGGGAASSVEIQGDNKAELDFGAVQRGDAEMEQKLNRVIRGCMELGNMNPILSIHDQGAGGNGNVLKELVEPVGAVIFTKNFTLGDPSISALELWGAEYQESNALVCNEADVPLLKTLANRERCPIDFVGVVTGSGKVILSEEENADITKYMDGSWMKENKRHPVDLDLQLVLGKMPRKVFNMESIRPPLEKLKLPSNLTISDALNRVLRLPSVASKRYLTNKVDRCVTGLIAQQQCVGPLHTPLADVAVTAVSHFNLEGIATAIGEQPIKGLLCPKAGARMTVAESLTNLVFARISDLRDVKCSGNWMWAAKLPGEGAALVQACKAMCHVMKQLGIAIDGGKDSLSMAARVQSDTVKAPGTLVISTYAPCPDVRQIITPDLKRSTGSALVFVDLSGGMCRLGGSALAQCYGQIGDEVPDLDRPELLKSGFNTTQKLIQENKLVSGHDISDGGLITTILEMCFGGVIGVNVNITHKRSDAVSTLFAEEVGWLLEVDNENVTYVLSEFKNAGVPCYEIGRTCGFGMTVPITICVNGSQVLRSTVYDLYRIWEETSYRLELRQASPICVRHEFENLKYRTGPKYKLTFDTSFPPKPSNRLPAPPRVAVIREEGSNGDREMAASLFQAGFEVWDVTMQDLLNKVVTVDQFRGVIFPGGFSYADVLGSAKGWAASLLFHPDLKAQFRSFAARPDTFSLGVCNGCQLMSLLGWIGTKPLEAKEASSQPDPEIVLEHNNSERFECRFTSVKFMDSPAIMLKGMAGSIFGVWIAHGEGKFTFKNDKILKELSSKNVLAIRYVDDNGEPTESYPMNPNGSTMGIAGVCSLDGRHLAMMPHPERCTQLWQWPTLPEEFKTLTSSPWLRIFQNAFNWCHDNYR